MGTVAKPVAASDPLPRRDTNASKRANLLTAARAATSHRGHTGAGSSDEEEHDEDDERGQALRNTRRAAIKPNQAKISLAAVLQEARQRGNSKRALMTSVTSASRAELEYMVQVNEREILTHAEIQEKGRGAAERYRLQAEKLNQLLEDQKVEMQLDAAEILRLRRFKEEVIKEKAAEKKAGPSDEAWVKLRGQEKKLREKEDANEQSLRQRQLQLQSGEEEVKRSLSQAAEREAAADAKAAAAMQAMAAAEEATAAAEAAAEDAARNKHKYMLQEALRAVAVDRMRTRQKRAENGGGTWWEQMARSSAPQEKKKEDPRSGLTLMLDLEYLLACLTGEGAKDGREVANPTSALPELLRATAAGRAAESVVIHRAPRGVMWAQAFIAEASADKLLHDQAAEKLGEPMVGLATFLMQWAASRFGMASTVALNLWTLHQALTALRPRSIEAATWMMFLELPEKPRSNRIISFYLHARALVANDIIRLAAADALTSARVAFAKADSGSRGQPRIGGAKVGLARPSSAGVLLDGRKAPPSSFRGAHGGELGNDSYRFLSGMSDEDEEGSTKVHAARQRRGALFVGSAIAPTAAAQNVGHGSAWEQKAEDLIRSELSKDMRGRAENKNARRVILLSRAWEAAQQLFRPAAEHVRLALLRELQAAAAPYRLDVPPPLRSLTPLEQHVVDFEHFLLVVTVFYDFSTQLNKVVSPHLNKRGGRKMGGVLADYPLSASALAVLKRSINLDMDKPEKEDYDRLQPIAIGQSPSNSFSQGAAAQGGGGSSGSVLGRAGAV